MSVNLLIIVTIIYGCIAGDSFWNLNYKLGIVFSGYTLANIGLIWAMME